MRPPHPFLTLVAATLAAGLSAAKAGDDPLPTPPPDPNTLTNPNDDKNAVTPAEVAECMKSWDAETGMSKDEYEKSCKNTLKYFPEKGD